MSVADLIGSVTHPGEIVAMFRLKFGGYVKKTHDKTPLETCAKNLSPLEFCYEALNKVSRSFAVVIQQLPEELKDPICLFYLILRGLDSVEDDMTYPLAQKRPLLLSFHEKLYIDDWCIKDVGDSADYRTLLLNFGHVIKVFKTIKPGYQSVIADITKRMGAGMAEFVEKKYVKTNQDYNMYCHYVAGLVGHGLSRLFAASKLEDAELASDDGLRVSNSMGLFLQKTNIIRDYLEDLDQGRTWWPDQIWASYALQGVQRLNGGGGGSSGGDSKGEAKLDHFKYNPNAPESIACLNHMVTDALELVPDCLQYLTRLTDPQIFRFCAIPQVMAIATLAEVYNNKHVFSRVVKIRKGLSAKLMLDTNNMDDVYRVFHHLAKTMERKVPPKDPSAARTRELLEFIHKATASASDRRPYAAVIWIVLALSVLFLVYRARQRNTQFDLMGRIANRPTLDWPVAMVIFLCLSYIFGYFGLSYV